MTAPTSAQPIDTARACTLEREPLTRLACYDSIYMPAKVSEPSVNNAWSHRTSTSPIDDSKEVQLTVKSSEPVSGRYRDHDRASLILRCQENTTAAVIYFGGAFVADSGDYGRITYRIDRQPATERTWVASTSNQHLGLWSGGASIPFIKSLFGGQKMIVRATPFNENPIVLEFDISGVEAAVEELRATCAW
ncbi:type VI secretion system-associated protein TagO [Devosia crocina]|nr:type VI secretion system-associated protein TagO [Devosia crocina]